jgi:hypothetical protein
MLEEFLSYGDILAFLMKKHYQRKKLWKLILAKISPQLQKTLNIINLDEMTK